MSRWRDHVRGWLDAAFTRHDDAYLAEALARAVDRLLDCTPVTSADDVRAARLGMGDALRAYRAQNPRRP